MAALVPVGPVISPDIKDEQSPYADIILPPEAFRAIIDKTAEFVAAKGVEFERRMLIEPNAKDRFEFLFASSPYRAYYDAKLREHQAGTVHAARPAVPEAISDMRKREHEKKEKKVLMLKSYAERFEDSGDEEPTRTMADEEAIPRPPEELPDPERFALRHPYIAPVDSDVMKLTAQYVARNGHSFLAGLQQRERTNAQFEFLKPSHPTHAYFNDLVACYELCYHPDHEIIQRLKVLSGMQRPLGKSFNETYTDDDSTRHIVKLMRQRFRWNAEENKKKKAKEEAEAEERAAMSAIDWDDLVVVETIVFTEADLQLNLPVPVDYDALAGTMTDGPGGRQAPAPAPMVPIPTQVAAEITRPMFAEQPEWPVPKRQEPAKPVTVTTTIDGEEQRVVLKSDYVRTRRRGEAKALLKCPLTGQLVAANNMTQHLRVLLMDPKWKEQRDQLLMRAQKESAFAPESDVEANIAQFVVKRPDLFGTVEDEILEHTSEPLSTFGLTPGQTSRPGSVVPPPVLGNVQILAPPPAAVPLHKKPRIS